MTYIKSYDEAVAVQAAALLLEQGVLPDQPDVTEALARAAPSTQRGFELFTREWQAGSGGP